MAGILDRVLDLSPDGPADGRAFIQSGAFAGRRIGYVFKNGSLGVGYYRDQHQAVGKKRGREYEIRAEDDDEDHDGEGKVRSSSNSTKRLDIEKLVDQAEEIKALDTAGLRALLSKLDKRIHHNQEQRVKFAQAPEKFMESEIELHATLVELQAVAASPELYPTLLQNNSIESVLNLITHDNTDISIAAIDLLQEMTDADEDEDEDEDEDNQGEKQRFFVPLAKSLIEQQTLELIVENMGRLASSSLEEDAQGVYSSLSLLENLFSLWPTAALVVCERTSIFGFLLGLIMKKPTQTQTQSAQGGAPIQAQALGLQMDASKAYSSELLSVLLQAAESNRTLLLGLKGSQVGLAPDVALGAGADAVECLLQTLAVYKKRDPTASDEAEFVQNVFLSLRALLLHAEGQRQFCAAEGFELMVRLIKEQRFCTAGAIVCVSYAVQGNRTACLQFVSAGGLRYIFPALMGVGVPKAYLEGEVGSGGGGQYAASTGLTRAQVVQAATATICHMVLQLHSAGAHELDAGARLVAKLSEGGADKAARCAELFALAAKKLRGTEKRLERQAAQAVTQGDDEAIQRYQDEQVVYALRLAGGLADVQQAALLLGYAFLFADGAREVVQARLAAVGGDMQDVLAVLREWAAFLPVESVAETQGSAVNGGAATTTATERQTLVRWCAALAQLIRTSDNS